MARSATLTARVQVEAVHVDKVGRPVANGICDVLPETRVAVVKEHVWLPGNHAGSMNAQLPGKRPFGRDRHRFEDLRDLTLQRRRRTKSLGFTRLVVTAGECNQCHVKLALQLLQDMERAIRHAAMGRVRKTL